MGFTDQDPHQRKVAQHRNRATRYMKSKEPADSRGAWSVTPGVARMPEEIVHQREFDRRGRSVEIVARHPMAEERERSQLDCRAHRPYKAELPEAKVAVHRSGSSRYS